MKAVARILIAWMGGVSIAFASTVLLWWVLGLDINDAIARKAVLWIAVMVGTAATFPIYDSLFGRGQS